MIICKKCGAANDNLSVYCAYCGDKLADQNKPTPKVTPTPVAPPEDHGIELNLPLDYYKQYMSDDNLYNLAISRLDGVVLKKNQNEAIETLVYLANRGHIRSILKLADICLRDLKTKEEAIVLLKHAASIGSLEAINKLQSLGIKYEDSQKRDVRPKRIPFREDDYDDFDDIKPIQPNDIKEAAIDKIVLIKTISMNGLNKKFTAGFLADGGYIVTSYDAIYKGAYKSVSGCFLNSDDRQFSKLKVCKMSKKYNVAILHFVNSYYDEFDYADNLMINVEYETNSTAFALGVAGGKAKVCKIKVAGPVRYPVASGVSNALKLKGSIDKKLTTPILLNEEGEVIGLIIKISDNCAYALPAEYIYNVLIEFMEE